jgi:hypothetical protein
LGRRFTSRVVLAVAVGLAALAAGFAGSAGAVTLFESVSFGDSQHGWLAGRYGDPDGAVLTVVWRTSDGGVSWQDSRYRQSPGWGVSPVVGFSGTSSGILASFEGLLWTGNGGTTWAKARLDGRRVPQEQYSYPSVGFATRQTGWLVADVLQVEG